MARPSLIRADTIDLQDHDAPSAKQHPKQNSTATTAPHQAETLREIAHETAEEEARSPRVSWSNGDPLDGGGGIDPGAQSGDTNMAAAVSGKLQQQQQQQQHEDSLAVAQNGGLSSSDEGDMDGDGDDLDDDMMDRISSSPSIEDEDIDFEFVYALHTFVATVEGQANATKGDTMVLLDDSNSYWWLVRVVKDSSIGYLPAEHIETPTERLARLNKHRNVDLSATMLGDQAPKPKTSFKSIRKRKKTVTFTDPTYVDYSDFDYSSDEEDIQELFGQQAAGASEQKQEQQQSSTVSGSATEEAAEESAKVEPLKTRTQNTTKAAETANAGPAAEEEEESETRDSEEIMDASSGGGLRQTRNGTIRNTDSFFKDDTVETKKMTLTPNLLRDDNQPRASTESATKDIKTRPSLDKMDKELVSDKEKKKLKEKEKREKDKKPSAIRSFFSRKDKKKASEDDDESLGKPSMDLGSDPRDSEDLAGDEQSSPEKSSAPQRQTSKLQKPQRRGDPSPTRMASGGSQNTGNAELSSYLSENRVNDVANVPPASMRVVDPDTKETQEVSSTQAYPTQERSASAAGVSDDRSRIAKALQPRSASAALETRPEKTNKARTRMQLDGSDLEEEQEPSVANQLERTVSAPQVDADNRMRNTRDDRSEPAASRPQLPGAFPDSYQTATEAGETTVTYLGDRDSDSPLPVSPISNPPALMGDTSSQDGVSPEHSPSPELDPNAAKSAVDQEDEKQQQAQQTWDDSKLRAFFDESDHIRDLLVVVYDKTDVVPAGSDHPVVGPLFREQNAKLAEITTQLDNMLGDWLARKQRLRGSV
ncbi:hypothetical protein NLU13_4667 [Sarocladium strictum]|uniref:SH3 domain-containing protein n=1 Tax=Sarocladium strictum TaxID=5046 RepID=A0AA39GKP5_SARSR|nr:hypothetical protein NLU13_4667 [Sarocladium strictum]